MAKATTTGSGATRFIDTALTLIAEEGGSQNVNLRQISRRLGCAHTNVYNYFASYEDLLWAAFRRAIRIYAEFLVQGLDASMPPAKYLNGVVSNLAAFPQAQPGLFRFIGSDPINLDSIPDDILDSVGAMKTWLFEVLHTAYPELEADEATTVSNIVLAYIDGETLNLINSRMTREEDIHGRVIANALRLIDALTGSPPTVAEAPAHGYPTMGATEKGV